MPARSWASPPVKIAMPTTTLGTMTPRVWTLIKDRMNVVDAKENRPLHILVSPQNRLGGVTWRGTHRGPGLPMREGWRGA